MTSKGNEKRQMRRMKDVHVQTPAVCVSQQQQWVETAKDGESTREPGGGSTAPDPVRGRETLHSRTLTERRKASGMRMNSKQIGENLPFSPPSQGGGDTRAAFVKEVFF